MIINKKFFSSKNTVRVARELLGKFLVRKRGSREIAAMIVEVEAYDGPRDKASHAHRGKTPRNEVMFGSPGHWYVYFTYGMHWMLNIVVGPKDYPAAVLIRGVEDVTGPARITKKLDIDKRLNKKTAAKTTGLWIEDRGVRAREKDVVRTPRIGVSYAGAWAKKPYRFVLKT